MENIYNNYKNIVERAIQAGIITDDSKDFYLSAIDEENDSELSELESRLNKEDEIASDFNNEQKKKYFLAIDSINENNDAGKMTKVSNNDDSQSVQSEGTIENYSILDLKHPKQNIYFINEIDSDICSINEENADPKSIQEASSKVITKVEKKLIKNQIVDFDVPIYLGIKRKKHVRKLSGCHSMNSARQESINLKNFKRDDSKKVVAAEKTQSRWMHPKTRVCVEQKDKNIPSKNVRYFIDSITTNQLEQNSEVVEDVHQDSKKISRRKSGGTCLKLARKEVPDPLEENKEVIPNKQTVNQNEKIRQYANKKKSINTMEQLKVPKISTDQERRFKIKLKRSVDPNVYLSSCEKNETNCKVCIEKDKRSHCKCNFVCKPMQHTSNVENCTDSASENGTSIDIPLDRNPSENDWERSLNINIICQFYQDDGIKKQKDIQDNKYSTNPEEAVAEKLRNDVPTEEIPKEDERAKQGKKTDRFSKIFANMKIKKKQKMPDCLP